MAEGTQYLPEDRLQRAQVLQWLFFEQYSHEPFIAVWKFRTYWAPNGFDDLSEAGIDRLKERGQAAIDVMEKHLAGGKEWFVGDEYSIADICLYAYTSAAGPVGFRIEHNVSSWLERIETVGGWVRMKKDPTGRQSD